MNYILEDEARAFLNGNPGVLNEELLAISVGKVSAAYNENQVSADQLYYNKMLLLSGIIQSINSGIGNEPYIVLYDASIFLAPQAHFQEENTQKIATLRKGQKIHLVCRGNGALVGAPMFKDCQFAEDYAKNRLSDSKLQIADFLDGKEVKSKMNTANLNKKGVIARSVATWQSRMTAVNSLDCRATLAMTSLS